jgi:hypothetical protein
LSTQTVLALIPLNFERLQMVNLNTRISLQFKVVIYSERGLPDAAIQDALILEMAAFDSSFADLNSEDLDISFASCEFSPTVAESLEFYGLDEIEGFEFRLGQVVVNTAFETEVDNLVAGEEFLEDLNFEWEPLYSVSENLEVVDCQSEIVAAQSLPV